MGFGVLHSPVAALEPDALKLRSEGPVSRLRLAGQVAAGLAIVSLLWALEQAAVGLFLGALLATHVSVGALFFVALQHATNARWSVALRRVAEALASLVPYAGAALFAVVVFNGHMYPWRHETLDGFKGFWLSWPFFLARVALYIIVWGFFARKLVSLSLTQTRENAPAKTLASVRWSVAFLPLFALTYWLASFDLIMSLEPEWYSTIFGVYVFSGSFTAALAAIILLTTWLLRWGPRGNGPLAGFVNDNHLHDLGKLLFAFCTFWAYIWFSQFMLIWYANLPEEAEYFVRRLEGFGEPLFILNLFLNWVVPFLALLPRASKRHPAVLRNVALVVLGGHVLDLVLMVVPAVAGHASLPSLWQILPMLAAVLLLLSQALRLLQREPALCWADPFLPQSLHHRG